MLGFFSYAFHFEAIDLHLWGPLAADLGIAVSTGLKRIYNGPERGLLRKVWDRIYGSSERASNDEAIELLGSDDRRAPNV